jgi:hypothetical protein
MRGRRGGCATSLAHVRRSIHSSGTCTAVEGSNGVGTGGVRIARRLFSETFILIVFAEGSSISSIFASTLIGTTASSFVHASGLTDSKFTVSAIVSNQSSFSWWSCLAIAAVWSNASSSVQTGRITLRNFTESSCKTSSSAITCVGTNAFSIHARSFTDWSIAIHTSESGAIAVAYIG